MNVGQWVELTIDFPSFNERIFENYENSIFDDPVLSKLKEWRISYGLFVRIRCDYRGKTGGIQCKIQKEIENTAWISFVHSDCADRKFVYFDIENSVRTQEVIKLCTEYFFQNPRAQKIPVLIYENQFLRYTQEYEKCWQSFTEIRRPICLNASALYGDKLYFSACNAPYLFEYDLRNEEIRILVWLPCRAVHKFSSLIYFEDNIWMFPGYEDSIYIYDLSERDLMQIKLPNIQNAQGECMAIQETVFDGTYARLFLRDTDQVIRFDLGKKDFGIIDEPQTAGVPSEKHTSVNYELIKEIKYSCANVEQKNGEPDSFEWNGRQLVIPYMGNVVIEMGDHKIHKVHNLNISLMKIDRSLLSKDSAYRERAWTTLEWFVQKARQKQIGV